MRLRTFVTPLVIAALAISLTGCGAGSNATTRLTKKVTDGQEAEIKNDNNKMVLRNFVLVAQPDGSAVVVGTAVNRVVALEPAPQPVSEIARAAITSGVTNVRRRISYLQVL